MHSHEAQPSRGADRGDEEHTMIRNNARRFNNQHTNCNKGTALERSAEKNASERGSIRGVLPERNLTLNSDAAPSFLYLIAETIGGGMYKSSYA